LTHWATATIFSGWFLSRRWSSATSTQSIGDISDGVELDVGGREHAVELLGESEAIKDFADRFLVGIDGGLRRTIESGVRIGNILGELDRRRILPNRHSVRLCNLVHL
jgi:hypothetical protein